MPTPLVPPSPAVLRASFAREWALRNNVLLGPPSGILGLWIVYQSPDRLPALAAVVFYALGNMGISHLEQRSERFYWNHTARALFNVVSLSLIAWVVGSTPVAWLIAIPTVVGSTFSRERWQARLIQFGSIVPQAIVSALMGVSPMQIITATVVLAMLAFVLENIYAALHESSFKRLLREHEVARVNRELETALAVRSRFLATMSHEIRTPMNGVLGMAELLDNTELADKQRDMVRVIRSSGQGLLQVINDILDLSKLEAGRVELEHVPYQPQAIVHDVIVLLRHAGTSTGVDLRCEFSDVPDNLMGAPSRLRQVLVNLVGNAVKFTREGAITVRCRWADERLEIAVIDTGPGVPPEKQATLFEPFIQADNSNTRTHGGTGLGLSISRRLVEAMDGTLTLESTVGVGSTFRFDVVAPRACAPVVDVGPSSEQLGSEDRIEARVMVVDDNPVNLAVATAMLRHLGCTVTDMDNAHDALAQFRADDFDVVLMDCQMPGMDGFEATQALRNRGVRLPIIALTAGVMSDEMSRCVDVGMDEVLAKPATMDALRDIIIRHATRSFPAEGGMGDTDHHCARPDKALLERFGHSPNLARASTLRSHPIGTTDHTQGGPEAQRGDDAPPATDH